jgi:hypothetical protein
MRKTLISIAAVAALTLGATAANADPNAAGGAAAGAAVGAGVGAVVGGPVGAAVGAGVGGTMGAGAASSSKPDTVIIEKREPSVSERNCVRDSAGNVVCTEIRR